MKNSILAIVFCTVFTLPFVASAGPIVRTGETVSVDADQTVGGDFYGVGSKVFISGANQNDVYLIGGSVTVNGSVAEDLTVIAGTVQVQGDVKDDVRSVGGDVVVSGHVTGDVVVVGGTLSILSSAKIDGDVLFFGEELTVDGPVAGAIHGTADIVRIDTEVDGDVNVTANKSFSLGSKSKIDSTITYAGPQNVEVVRAQDALISGEVRKVTSEDPAQNAVLRIFFIELLSIAFAAFVMFFVIRSYARRLVASTQGYLGVSGLVGLALLICIPFICVLLCVSVIGVVVGVALFFVYLTLIAFSIILSPVLLGVFVQRLLNKGDEVTFVTVSTGVLVFFVLSIIPFGSLVLSAAVLVVLGAFGRLLYKGMHST